MKTLNSIIKTWTFGILFGILMALLAEGGVVAKTLLPDVGMVTQVTGKVTYWDMDTREKPARAQPFMKVRKDDHFRLSKDAVVQVVFFSNGRKETWKGPVTFKVTSSEGQATGDRGPRSQPQVLSLPGAVSKEVKRVSILVDPSKLHHAGVYQVRGHASTDPKKKLQHIALDPEEKKKIAGAKQIYQTLLKEASSGDITPELYLFSVLADYDLSEEMENLIDTMRQKQPDYLGIDRLEKWLRGQKL